MCLYHMTWHSMKPDHAHQLIHTCNCYTLWLSTLQRNTMPELALHACSLGDSACITSRPGFISKGMWLIHCSCMYMCVVWQPFHKSKLTRKCNYVHHAVVMQPMWTQVNIQWSFSKIYSERTSACMAKTALNIILARYLYWRCMHKA